VERETRVTAAETVEEPAEVVILRRRVQRERRALRAQARASKAAGLRAIEAGR